LSPRPEFSHSTAFLHFVSMLFVTYSTTLFTFVLTSYDFFIFSVEFPFQFQQPHFVLIMNAPDELSYVMGCVCKTWNTLISNPTFVKLHLQQSTRNKHLTLILCDSLHCSNAYYFDKDFCVVPFPIDSLLHSPSITIVNKPYYPHKIKLCFQFIGLCNGLIFFFVFPLENCCKVITHFMWHY
jgi:hypothetical protein